MEDAVMVKTFSHSVSEAMAEVAVISPTEAQQRMQRESRTLVIDPRDAADIPATGIIPGFSVWVYNPALFPGILFIGVAPISAFFAYTGCGLVLFSMSFILPGLKAELRPAEE